VLAFGGWPLAAEDSLVGKNIEKVEIVGLESLTEDTVLFYLGLEEGEPYDPEQLNDKVHELWQHGLIDEIGIEAHPYDWGVRLVVTIVERPTLAGIEYQGLKRLQKSDIETRIAKEGIGVREGQPLEPGELRRLERAIESLYAEKGFGLADASFSLVEVSHVGRQAIFIIDEGRRIRIEDIDFEGNTVFGDRRLRWAMKQTKQSGVLARLQKKDVYDPAALDQDLEKVIDLYRRNGYKNVVVGEPVIQITVGKPGAEKIESQKRRLAITVPVEEGDRWRFGEIRLEGNQRFSEELLLRQFEASGGDWLSSDVIDKGIAAIAEIYSNTGHLYAKVEPRLIERQDHVADVVVQIDEGEQYRIGRIEFEGNTKTKDEVLRREMAIQEGAVLDTGALRNSLLRLSQLEYFIVDSEDPVALDVQADKQIVDLSIKGEEGEPTDLLFGGGFGEASGFFGQIQYRTRNFLGRGETLSASAQVGQRQNIFDLSYGIPWFLDRPQQVGFSLFKRDLEYTLLTGQNVNQDRVGGSVSYGRRLGIFSNLTVTYTRFDSDELATNFADPDNPVVISVQQEVSMLGFGYIRDRRDSRVQPTVGGRWSLGLDWAGGALGGNTDFLRPQATFSRYLGVTKKTFRSLVAVNVEAGYVTPIGDSELVFSDRFFLGGENSVRGFEYKSIWVRDEEGNTVLDQNGLALGGNRSLQLNLEYHVLFGKPFRLLAFTDLGKVSAEGQPFNFDHASISAGLELQIKLPILGAPLRLIWSQNLDPLPEDRFQTFQFSIGPSF